MNRQTIPPLSRADRTRVGVPLAERRPPRKVVREGWSFPRSEAEDYARIGKDLGASLRQSFQKVLEQFPSIAMNDDVLGGTPRIAGTRVPLYMVVRAVRHFGSIEGAMEEYDLTRVQVTEALAFAASVLELPREYEP